MVVQIPYISYITNCKPYDNKGQNNLELANEIVMLVALYMLIWYTDFVTDSYD